MTMRLLLGIDPGLSGALAWLDMDTGSIVQLSDMPIVPKTSKKKAHINIKELADLIAGESLYTDAVVIEYVSAAPKQGLASTFKFGFGTGVLHGICTAHNMLISTVPPAVWKMGLGLSRSKDESRALASKIWPEKAQLFERKKDDGRAEAALIGHYGLRSITD